MLLPTELAEGMNKVVAPVVVLLTEIRSGWWIEASPAEYWCRAEARLLRKPSSSEAVRPSSSPRIWSSVRTMKGIFGYFTGTDRCICKKDSSRTQRLRLPYKLQYCVSPAPPEPGWPPESEPGGWEYHAKAAAGRGFTIFSLFGVHVELHFSHWLVGLAALF
jgi:hypothetical protein